MKECLPNIAVGENKLFWGLRPKEFATLIQEAILDYPEMKHFDVEIPDVDKNIPSEPEAEVEVRIVVSSIHVSACKA